MSCGPGARQKGVPLGISQIPFSRFCSFVCFLLLRGASKTYISLVRSQDIVSARAEPLSLRKFPEKTCFACKLRAPFLLRKSKGQAFQGVPLGFWRRRDLRPVAPGCRRAGGDGASRSRGGDSASVLGAGRNVGLVQGRLRTILSRCLVGSLSFEVHLEESTRESTSQALAFTGTT